MSKSSADKEVNELIKLLVIADDLTGALDTGIQFGSTTALVKLYTCRRAEELFEQIPGNAEVLIVDTETRHSDRQSAYEKIYQLVRAAKEARVSCIYKKTDSGMRGNIGSELSAVLAASEEDCIHFVPAFPQIGRITADGIQYIDGVPVAESVFGKDPFEPVQYSSVREIIGSQCDTEFHVRNGVAEDGEDRGILLYNCSSQEDLRRLAEDLKARGQFKLLAGCAGFAAVLPEMVGVRSVIGGRPKLSERLLVICGSLNPVSLRQMDVAEEKGALRIRLSNRQKLYEDFFHTAEGIRFVGQIVLKMEEYRCVMIESSDPDESESSLDFAQANGIGTEEIRSRISASLGILLSRLLDQGIHATIFITGGDTLLSFMQNVGLDKLSPVCELYPGVVLSEIEYKQQTCHLISKSGGFGNEDLLLDIQKKIDGNSIKEEEHHEKTDHRDINGRPVWQWAGDFHKGFV